MTSHAAKMAALSTTTGVRKAGLSCGATDEADLNRSTSGVTSPAPMIHTLMKPSAAIVTEARMLFNLPLLNAKPTSAEVRQIGSRYFVSVSRREDDTPYVIICSARMTSKNPAAFTVNIFLSKRRIIPTSANLNGLGHAPSAPSQCRKFSTPIHLPARGAPETYPAFLAELHGTAHRSNAGHS